MNYMINRYIHRLTTMLLVSFLVSTAYANESGKSIFDLMNYKEVLEIEVAIDLDSIIEGRRSEEGFKTTLHFMDEMGQSRNWNINISMRGRFRRVHCETPPLKVDFKKSELKGAGLASFDDMKLVTHCVSDPFEAKELILKEYLVYKMYNQLTEYSYRVQLVKVTYRNPDTGKEDLQWGFFIEDTAELSTRMDAEKVETMTIALDTLDQEYFRMMALLQYMVGNIDWGLKPVKNLKLLQKDGRTIPVAYDFDFSSLVGASYARPTIAIGLQPVQQLTYARIKEHESSFAATSAHFQANRKMLLRMVKQLKVLSFRSRVEVVEHLNTFFERIDIGEENQAE